MGHLINPIAYRLGHSRSWEDNWFVKNIYYPEFLHSILKIRCYIYYFWTTRDMEKKGILFSHFYIYKFLKNLLIKIFLYNTDLEKNSYSFYARGVGIFSDSFHYRLKKKKKKKEPHCYDRYKPDLFFPFFIYYVYFSREQINRDNRKKKSFIFNILNIEKIKKKKLKLFFLKKYDDKKRVKLIESYFESLKNSNLNFFLKNLNITRESRYFSNALGYERKFKRLNSKKVNLGFLDFFIYLFFKINMLDRKNDDLARSYRKKRNIEMVFNYSLKIKKLIFLLKKFLKLKLRLGLRGEKKRKRSVSNFILFLVFILNIFYKMRYVKGRKKFKLGDLNMKLVRLFIFNRILTQFAFFYGNFLSHIVSILVKNLKKAFFKFCFVTNNSINAKFIARYIGLKLKKKFPLFFVINPLKKEFKKLANKKKKRKLDLLYNHFNYGSKLDKFSMTFKDGFKNFLSVLFNKFLSKSLHFYRNSKTLITTDIYIYFLLLKNKYKYPLLSKFLKKTFKQDFKLLIWKKKKLNNIWIKFLLIIVKKKIYNKIFLEIKKFLFKFLKYIKNKLLVNLFFSFNKYNVDSLVLLYSRFKWRRDTFNFFHSGYMAQVFHNFFYNYNILNKFVVSNFDLFNVLMSTYFYRSYMFYLHSIYTFKGFENFVQINKRKRYLRLRSLYQPSSLILGYKMSFKGRFTRKQRASSIWFHQGFVPLNTFKGFIDYSFFTIPLKNSAISIKLWLYKNKDEILWDNKFLNERIY